MVAQKGKDLLLKLDSTGRQLSSPSPDCAPSASPSTARRSTSPMPNSAGRWRELLAGSGVQRASISGSGIFKDAQSDATIRSAIFRRRDRRLANGRAGFRHDRGTVPDHRARIYRQP